MDSKYNDITKWAETEGIRIDFDDAMEIVVFSGAISPAKDQVIVGIITQPSFEPQTKTSDMRAQTSETSPFDQHLRSRPVEGVPLVSSPPDVLNPTFDDPSPRKQSSPPVEDIPTVSMPTDAVKPNPSGYPPQKRRKVKQRPAEPRGAEFDRRLDSSMLGQQTQVKIVRDVGNPTFQVGGIICIDEHDTLQVQGYIVLVWLRYRVVRPSSMLEG